MTQTIRELRGDQVLARDGSIGSVDDVYFDDERWAVRYLVVDTGGWLAGNRVLISPASVETSLSSAKKLRVALTREQIESAPPAESDRPVSRRYEIAHARHYGYPHYWAGPMLWGAGAYPIPSAADATLPGEAEAKPEEGDPHLRSGAEVIGYGIEARDGAIGDVEDFIVDDRSWAIRDIVVDTLKWWPGGHVHVHPEYVELIDWSERKMHLRLTREQVKLSGATTPRR
jgi:sporulation protein YlmC with PRC-barrel domain